MEKTTKVTESSDLRRKINALGLPARQRQQAFASLEVVERLAYVIAGVAKLLKARAPVPAAAHRKLRPQ